MNLLRPALAFAPCLLLAACASLPTEGQRAHTDGVVAIGSLRGGQTLADSRPGRIEGVVTAPLDGPGGAAGWLVQDGGDGDAATTDALWVTGPAAAGLAPGQTVRLSGRLFRADFGGQALAALEAERAEPVASRGQRKRLAAIAPVGYDGGEGWPALIGMRVRLSPQVLAESDGKRGQLLVAPERLWQPAERHAPGSDAARSARQAAARQLQVSAAPGLLAPALFAARSGSRLEDLQGVMIPAGKRPGLLLERAPTLVAAERPAPPQVAGDLRIAAFNLENLFNGDGRGGGFPTPRGARSLEEYQRQRDKLVQTIHTLAPDVAALMELENDGYGAESTLADLVAALDRADAAVGGAQDWRFAAPCRQPCAASVRGPGEDEIRVGLVYRGSRVAAVGLAATLQGGPFGPRARVPMAQAFRALDSTRRPGPAFVVVANHFKSKGCRDATGADADQGDGAACWNASRTESAQRLDAWLKTDPTGSGSAMTMIVGDLNAYAQEQPLRTLYAAGWRDAFAEAGAASPYSYVYDGQLGRLDHALLSPALAERLRGASEWHTNADEPDSAGYRAGGAGPWRSSDHDPMLLGFDLMPR